MSHRDSSLKEIMSRTRPQDCGCVKQICFSGEFSAPSDMDGNTVWLSQEQMSQLFGHGQSVIARHISNIFKEIGCADELGSGTRNLYHYTRLYFGADPIIDEEDAFSVTVPLNDGYSPEVGEGTRGNGITQTIVGDARQGRTLGDY